MSDARRLLVITYHFGAAGPVGGLRWTGLTKYLARLGWEVAVVTAGHASGTDAGIDAQVERCPRLWTLLDGLRALRGFALGHPVAWSPNGARALGQPSSGVLRQLYREVTGLLAFPDASRGWMLRAALRTRSMIRRFDPEVLVSTGPPHAAHLVARVATIGTAVRWWIDLRDPWAGPLPKIWESDPLLGSRVFRALTPSLERLAFSGAHGVITNTQQLAQVLAEKYPDLLFVSVPNGVDPESLPPANGERFPGLGIAHLGTLYAGRDVGPVTRALRIFLERHPDAAQAGTKLRVAGRADTAYSGTFHNAVTAEGMEPFVQLLGELPRGEALSVLSRSTLAVVLAQQQEHQIPAKLYESVAMGVPTLVVAPVDSATGIEGKRIGALVYDSTDVEGIACLLGRLWRDGSPRRPPCPVSITYDAIGQQVDALLRALPGSATSAQGDRYS